VLGPQALGDGVEQPQTPLRLAPVALLRLEPRLLERARFRRLDAGFDLGQRARGGAGGGAGARRRRLVRLRLAPRALRLAQRRIQLRAERLDLALEAREVGGPEARELAPGEFERGSAPLGVRARRRDVEFEPRALGAELRRVRLLAKANRVRRVRTRAHRGGGETENDARGEDGVGSFFRSFGS
jgi:hypothetical protein